MGVEGVEEVDVSGAVTDEGGAGTGVDEGSSGDGGGTGEGVTFKEFGDGSGGGELGGELGVGTGGGVVVWGGGVVERGVADNVDVAFGGAGGDVGVVV